VPITASIPAPRERHVSQTEVSLFVWDFSKGSLNEPSRKPYTPAQALVEASERAQRRHVPVVFIDWDKEVNRGNVGCDDAVIICRTLRVIERGNQGFTLLRDWPFDDAFPTDLLPPIGGGSKL
jgi:hypothetical protein